MALEDLFNKPGYQLRRMRQISAAVFGEEAAAFGVTAQQWTTLQGLSEFASIEQTALCEVLDLDRATMATLLARLEEKGLVRRTTPAADRRRKHVALTPRGRHTLELMTPVVERVQERILAPLSPADRREFARMLTVLVTTHGSSERAASEEEAS